jgi:hypothetical protein
VAAEELVAEVVDVGDREERVVQVVMGELRPGEVLDDAEKGVVRQDPSSVGESGPV